LFISFFSACTGLRPVSQQNPLLTAHDFEIITEKKLPAYGTIKDELESVVKPTPNNKFLWMRPALSVYNSIDTVRALSAVDTATEEEILARLSPVIRERTTVIVSHRMSTIRGADQILVLDAGRIAERGTHDELLERGGLYADLHRLQRLEDELEAS
jgi:hypothetical protein